MEKVQTLFDETAQRRLKARYGTQPLSTHPLYQEAQARLNERLEDIKHPFKHPMQWEGAAPKTKADLITSCLDLHHADNIACQLAAIYSCLTQEGLFLGVMIGGQSLIELRTCLMEAEIELTGGACARLHPLPDIEDLSRILPRIGFALPVIDHERASLTYPDIWAMMHDLRAYGCTNVLNTRSRKIPPHDLFAKAQELYKKRFAAQNGSLIATMDLVFLHGWKEQEN